VNKCRAGRTPKQYREDNKEARKKYADSHKEEKREYDKVYREMNRAKHHEKFDCECRGCYIKKHKQTHQKTKIHQQYLQSLEN
jgi:hypothetical protein